MNKKYLKKESDKILEAENRYDFIPNETSKHVALSSVDKLCLFTTKQIAIDKEKQLDTIKNEKKLRQYREYGLENLETD